jgi:hypothetical protein
VSASAVAEIASAVNGANNNTAATKVNHFEIASDVTPAIIGGAFREVIVTTLLWLNVTVCGFVLIIPTGTRVFKNGTNQFYPASNILMQGCDYQSIVQTTDKFFHCP